MSEPYTYVVEATAVRGCSIRTANGRQGRLSIVRNGRTTAFAGVVTGMFGVILRWRQ